MTGGPMASAAAAGAENLAAKVSVWWDIDTCPVGTGGCGAKAIAKNIKAALSNIGYHGPVSISAYGDTSDLSKSVKRALSSTEISLNHVVPAGKSDKKMLLKLMIWTEDNPVPSNFLLISGDTAFSMALLHLFKSGCNVLLAVPNKAYPPVFAAAKTIWLWNDLLAVGSPIVGAIAAVEAEYTAAVEAVEAEYKAAVEAMEAEYKAAVEAEYKAAQTSVWWDIGDCPVPEGADTTLIAAKINSALSDLGYTGRVTINVYGNLELVDDDVIADLATSGISLNDTSSVSYMRDFERVEDTSDTKMMSAMIGWALKNAAAPANFLLISGDSGFIDLLVALSDNGFNILLAMEGNGSDILRTAAKTVWDWPTLAGSGQPPEKTVFDLSFQRPVLQNQSPPPQVSSLPLEDEKDFILRVLDKLKKEMIIPTKENIDYCIRFGDGSYSQVDVDAALHTAVEQRVVVKQPLGQLVLYYRSWVGLWKVVNVFQLNADRYSKEIWEQIQGYLDSSKGQKDMQNSSCRYEAALRLKKACRCLEDLTLGSVLNIVNIVTEKKKWISGDGLSNWSDMRLSSADLNPPTITFPHRR